MEPYDDYTVIFWIQYCLYVIVSTSILYYYILRFNYINELVAVVYGFHCLFLFWIQLNSLISFILDKNGDFIIIGAGIVPLLILAVNRHKSKQDDALNTPFNKITNDYSALYRCCAIINKVKSTHPEEEQKLIGLINTHYKDCKDSTCGLNNPRSLYDSSVSMLIGDTDVNRLYRSKIFLKHFCKAYFDEAIKGFGNSIRIRIAYAIFLFSAFKNIHAALEELNIATKLKPGFIQSIEIFKLE